MLLKEKSSKMDPLSPFFLSTRISSFTTMESSRLTTQCRGSADSRPLRLLVGTKTARATNTGLLKTVGAKTGAKTELHS